MSWFRYRQILAKAMSTTSTYCIAASQLVIEKDELKEVNKELQKDRGRRIVQNVDKKANLEMGNSGERGKLISLLREIKEQQSKQLAHLEKTNAAKWYAATLLAPDSNREIERKNGHKYSAGIEDFIRHGAEHCRRFFIRANGNKGFVGYPANFFNDLVKYCYETEKPEEMIGHLVFELPTDKLAPWPSPLVQLHGANFGWVTKEQLKADGVPATLKEEKVEYGYIRKLVHYTLRNKHNPEVEFRLRVWFESGGAICYKQMTTFVVERKVG